MFQVENGDVANNNGAAVEGELDGREELHKFLLGEDSEFQTVFVEQFKSTVADGYHLYGNGFLYVMLAGLIFVVGYKAFGSVSRLIGG